MKEDSIYRMVYRVAGEIHSTLDLAERLIDEEKFDNAQKFLLQAAGMAELAYVIGDELKSGGCSTLGYLLADSCYETAMQEISRLHRVMEETENG